jgi:protein LTV1
MQDIPDSLRGFQPDMNPDLREVLETLEYDEAQKDTEGASDEDPDDMFAELVKGGAVEDDEYDEVDEAYESDDTVKGRHDTQDSEYLKEMAQYKTTPKKQEDTDSVIGGFTESEVSKASTAHAHRTSKQRRKRRQRLGGAYSEAGTDYSMTSSANYRNDGLTTLDQRFDKVFCMDDIH